MQDYVFDSIFNFRRRSDYGCFLQFALFWLAGFLSGIFFSLLNPAFAVCFDHLLLEPQTLFGSLVTLFFPLALSFLLRSMPWMYHLFAFVKSFALGYCIGLCLIQFGNIGWLAALLLLFSDISFQPWLYFFWFSHIDGSLNNFKRHVAVSLTAALVISFFDCFIVSPYLISLFII